MKTKLTYLIVLSFLFLFSSGVSGETKKFNIATGTGFFLGSSNYVVTNYHVIHGAKQIQVKLVNGEILDAEVALKNPEKDIAILRINGTPSVKRMNVKLSSFSEIRTGDKVFTYGFPMTDFLGDISSIYSEGVINSLKGIRNNPDEFQVSIPIQPGNSGGPIFNEQGTLIGVTTRTLSTVSATGILGVVPQNVNFGIKSSVLGKLLPEIPEILQFDMGIVPVPSQQFSLRDFKENIKNNIVFVSVSVEKEIGNFQVANEAYQKGDYKTALEQFKVLAEQGDAQAQYNLGLVYAKGQGVPQDDKEAIKWYRLSAEQGVAKAQYNLGVMYEKGRGVPQDYKEAVRLYRLSAEQGDAFAQNNLGVMYAKGQGVPQDDKEAIKWYRLSAEQGGAGAQLNLGFMYAKGQGVPQDDKEAIKWYRLSAEKGYAPAQNNLGSMYEKGLGVPQDHKESIKWYRLSAEKGHVGAQNNLGVMYSKGIGVPQDYKESVKWYRLSAEQGIAIAQYNLGWMYAEGKGVLQDYVLAHMWWNIAGSNGYKDAIKDRQQVETKMSQQQIVEAQEMARNRRNWKMKK